MKVNAARLRADLETLGQFGREPEGGVTRPAFSGVDMAARRWFAARAEESGLPVTLDPLCNVIVGSRNGEAAVWTGSHLDSVPNGGMFDGALGAVAALECVRRINESAVPLARPVQAVAFADEEGAFHGFIGSKALTGNFSADELAGIASRDGQPLPDLLRAHGIDPVAATNTALPAGAVSCFVELHIEQGPVLESTGTAIGVVTHIVGVNRGEIRFDGRSDHAGTTPMNLRRDALRGAASFLDQLPTVLAEAGHDDAVATCGRLTLQPGAENVVPETATVHLDFRDGTTEKLEQIEEVLIKHAHACASRHDLDLSYRRESSTPPVRLDGGLADTIERAAGRAGLPARRMPSGAGHDAQVMSTLAPTGMIFVPSQGGRSHSPLESTSWQDIEHGAEVLLATLLELAGAQRQVNE